MGGWKRFRNKTYAQVLGGKVSVEEARARYNLEAARRGKPPLKPAGTAGGKSAGAGVPQMWVNHSNPQIREGDWVAMVQKSAPAGDESLSPASLWTGLDRGLLHQYETHPDAAQREAARQALVDRGMLPGVPSRGDTQVPITLSPEVRGHLQLPGGWTI